MISARLANAVLDSCTENFKDWYAGREDMVTGVDTAVPSPFDIEFDTDASMVFAIAVAGMD